ncbi:MAG: DUF222 domain-containing protein [Acidimicrobiia bacterium]|nr:DUF222 domain-containing protein [Acidimicrobiia bacterium]
MVGEDLDTEVAALESVPAGADLAAALEAIVVPWLDPDQRVAVWQAHRRQAAHYQAKSYLDIISVKDHFLDQGDDDSKAFEGTSAEFEVAGPMTRRGASSEVTMAESLWRRLPQVGAALYRGDIDHRRARKLVDGTDHLPEDIAQGIVEDLLDVARELTPSQLEARIRRRCIDKDPEDAKTRYEQAVENRAAMTLPNQDGTATFYVHSAAPVDVYAAARHVDYLARQLKGAGDKRPIDQIRSDVALDLLRGKPHSHTARLLGGVHIHTSLETLTRLADHTGDLAGYGAVVADIARQTAEHQQNTQWDYSVTDTRGNVIATGTTQRRPTAAQTRCVRARFRTCVFPGCRMPAVDSDLDHRSEYSKTKRTSSDDLYPHCRYHHRIRHDQGWTYREIDDGRLEYTTRLGHKYLTQPRDPPLE